MRIDLLTLVLALLFAISLLAVDSVTAAQLGFFADLPFDADINKP